MKNIKILYWIITIIFGGFMLFTAIPDIMVIPDAVTFMTHLGYPKYFIAFIGVAKLLGVIAILIPGYPRIKEWAYAGLFFDLVGAIYSVSAVEGINGGTFFILLPIIFLFASYFLFHKMNKAASK